MSQKREIFLIPYAHLDTQWRWEYPTTIKKYIKNTLEENIHLFEKYSGHRFNFTGALRYSMMKEYYPEYFEKVRQYIEEGRWFFTGTSLDETDTLTPSAESMIRNILYGDRWVKSEFGENTDRTHMIPDCFGFPANMPSVLAHCGIHSFSSQKLTWNSAVGIPFDIGIWKGPDGNSVVSGLNPGSYVSPILFPIHKNPVRLNRLEKFGKKYGIWKSFQYYGVGDIGGSVREKDAKNAIASVEHSKIANDGLVVRQGSPEEFFSELTEEEKQRMDTYEGDLLLINHSAGTLTSATIMKRWNRLNEQMGFAAEVAAVTAMIVAGTTYPNDKIKSAWYRTIGNQMHDILTGTSTPTAYEYSHNDEVVALKTWDAVLHDSALALAPYVKGDGRILIFNPLGEFRRDPVDIELDDWNEENGLEASIIDGEGKSIAVQIHKNDEDNYQATFIPELKPFHWSRFTILPKKTGVANPVTINKSSDHFILENFYYRVKVSKKGSIESIFQKKMEKELLKRPLAYEFQKEKPAAFPAWNMDWKDRNKPPFLRIEDGGDVEVLEEGPLRCTLRITIPYISSKFVKNISLSQDSEYVNFTERIDWKEKGCSFKLALNANMTKPEVTYNWETSRIKRGLNNEKQYEMPSRYWVDMSEGNWGISIIEDSKYGYDHPLDDTLRMTLIYTPKTHRIGGYHDQAWHDWGKHTIRYGIFGHEGDFKQTDHLARRFNQKIRSFTITNEESSQTKQEVSLFKVSNKQLGILAVKKPEDMDGVLIRLYERYGEEVEAELEFSFDILEVNQVNGLEEHLNTVPYNGNKFTIKMGANAIHSYIVKLKSMPKPQNTSQAQIQLDYDSRMVGYQGGVQALFPAEITPKTIKSGTISYQIAKDAKENSMQCNSQKISLSNGYNTLSILVGSKEESSALFEFVDAEEKVLAAEQHQISPFTGFIGQWDTRLWKKEPKHFLKNHRDYLWRNKCIGIKPGYVNRERLEWYSTHTHKDGKDLPYRYGYMYTITLEIPEGTDSLVLPNDKNIHILAMTASSQPIKLKSSLVLNDKFDF